MYSLVDIAPSIAHLLNIPLDAADGKPIPPLLEYADGCKRIILIVVDSLGVILFNHLQRNMPALSWMAREGFYASCKAVASKTTPALTSILSGQYPQNHRVYHLDNNGPDVPCILELYSGSAVILEAGGAQTFRERRVSHIYPVYEREDIHQFDRDACQATLKAIRTGAGLVFTHFRGIDRDCHRDRGIEAIKHSARLIDDHINRITMEAQEDTLILTCGDHPPHTENPILQETRGVPLVGWRRG